MWTLVVCYRSDLGARVAKSIAKGRCHKRRSFGCWLLIKNTVNLNIVLKV